MSKKILILISIILSILLFSGACRTPGTSNGSGKTNNSGNKTTDPKDPKAVEPQPDYKIDETFVADQPEVPGGDDDAYFTNPVQNSETFRILITGGNYQVRQVSNNDSIRRKKDPEGDREQVGVYRGYSEKINFKKFVFTALLSVRLNPHSGQIEFIRFVPGHNPKIWQASNFFRDDLSRYAFSFPKKRVSLRSFRVQYEWRIELRDGLTKEQARQMVIDFLKSQKR